MSGSRGVRSALSAAVVAAALAGCGSEKKMPDLAGERLDAAAARLDKEGIGYTEVTASEPTDRAGFEVCHTEPPAEGKIEGNVMLVVRKLGECE
jgi:outer membrane murein-binding lipoprotein Lpp